MNDRKTILDDIRNNLSASGDLVEDSLPEIGQRRLEGDRNDMLQRLKEECAAVSTNLHPVRNIDDAARIVDRMLNENGVSRLVITEDPIVQAISSRVIGRHEVVPSSSERSLIEQADMGITTVRLAIAEHGTFVMIPDDDHGRLASLLPPHHLIVMSQDRLVGTLSEALQFIEDDEGGIPENVTFISGPSRTADIEQTLVTGIHGPAKLDVVLIEQFSTDES